MVKTMRTNEITTNRLLCASLIACLGLAIAACGGSEDKKDPPPVDAGDSTDDASDSTDPEEDASTDPAVGATCKDKVYSELSDECASCTCDKDPAVAPVCQKPCWDFLACSFVARSGKCASSAAGGAATRPEFEACIQVECGAQLAIPGAEAAGSYSDIVAACAAPMGGAKGACTDDIGKFAAGLKK